MWVWLSGFLVIGYLSLTRSFAYLGVPPLQIFIGAIALALFIVLRPGVAGHAVLAIDIAKRSAEHTSELTSLIRISYAVFCLKTTHYILLLFYFFTILHILRFFSLTHYF